MKNTKVVIYQAASYTAKNQLEKLTMEYLKPLKNKGLFTPKDAIKLIRDKVAEAQAANKTRCKPLEVRVYNHHDNSVHIAGLVVFYLIPVESYWPKVDITKGYVEPSQCLTRAQAQVALLEGKTIRHKLWMDHENAVIKDDVLVVNERNKQLSKIEFWDLHSAVGFDHEWFVVE